MTVNFFDNKVGNVWKAEDNEQGKPLTGWHGWCFSLEKWPWWSIEQRMLTPSTDLFGPGSPFPTVCCHSTWFQNSEVECWNKTTDNNVPQQPTLPLDGYMDIWLFCFDWKLLTYTLKLPNFPLRRLDRWIDRSYGKYTQNLQQSRYQSYSPRFRLD